MFWTRLASYWRVSASEIGSSRYYALFVFFLSGLAVGATPRIADKELPNCAVSKFPSPSFLLPWAPEGST
jgi:hypothetical protein